MSPLDSPCLPDDPESLRALVLDLARQRDGLTQERNDLSRQRDAEKERADRLEALNKQLRHLLYGRKSERLKPDDRQLSFEAIEQATAEAKEGPAPQSADDDKPRKPRRRRSDEEGRASLPSGLPEIERVIDVPASEKVCPCCGGDRHKIGEDVSKRLDVVPAQYRVLVTRRPRYGCRTCETGVAQAAAPAHVVEGGLPTEALIAHLLTAKYADGLPLYRQAGIMARQGITVDRSVLAGWVGAACWWLRPLYDALRRNLMASTKIYADETPLPVLDPGRGRTKTGQLWSYVRDDRPWCGPAPPAVVYAYATGRGATHAAGHLKTFGGVLQVDGYRAYKTLVADRAASKDARPITLAFCWSHSRRRFRDAQRQGTSPVAEEALRRIGELYRIEADIRGLSAEERLTARRERSAPLVEDLKRWLDDQADRLSRKTPVGDAVHYARRHWDGLCVFLEDGRVEIDSNAVERSFKPQVLLRKNALFAGADSGAEHWAMVASLIETAKLNGLNPQAYLTKVLETLVDDFHAKRIDELLPWNWKAAATETETPQPSADTVGKK